MKQLDFGMLVPGFRRRSLYASQAERLIEQARFVADRYGHAVVAEALSSEQARRSRSSISHAIAVDPKDRGRHFLRLADLPWFIDNDPTSAFIKLLVGFEQRQDPAELAQCMQRAALDLYGSEGRKGLLRKTQEILAETRVARLKR